MITSIGIDTGKFLKDLLASPEFKIEVFEAALEVVFGDAIRAYVTEAGDDVGEQSKRRVRAAFVAGMLMNATIAAGKQAAPPLMPSADELIKSFKLANPNYLKRKV